jgi:hypothetical protein
MRDKSAGIIAVPRTNCDGNNIRQLLDECGNFTRLFPGGLIIEHVEQITGNTDQVVIWRLSSYQLPKPVSAEVKIGG